MRLVNQTHRSIRSESQVMCARVRGRIRNMRSRGWLAGAFGSYARAICGGSARSVFYPRRRIFATKGRQGFTFCHNILVEFTAFAPGRALLYLRPVRTLIRWAKVCSPLIRLALERDGAVATPIPYQPSGSIHATSLPVTEEHDGRGVGHAPGHWDLLSPGFTPGE